MLIKKIAKSTSESVYSFLPVCVLVPFCLCRCWRRRLVFFCAGVFALCLDLGLCLGLCSGLGSCFGCLSPKMSAADCEASNGLVESESKSSIFQECEKQKNKWIKLKEKSVKLEKAKTVFEHAGALYHSCFTEKRSVECILFNAGATWPSHFYSAGERCGIISTCVSDKPAF